MKNSSADYHPLESTNCLQLNVLIEPQQSFGYFHKIIVLINIITPARYKNHRQDPVNALVQTFARQDRLSSEDLKMGTHRTEGTTHICTSISVSTLTDIIDSQHLTLTLKP